MKKFIFSLLLLCTPFTPLMAVYDAETGYEGYEVRLDQIYDCGVKVWITYPDGTVAKRITDFKHDGYASDDRFFIPNYRIESGNDNDNFQYKSMKLRIHMQEPSQRGNGLLSIFFDTFTPPRHRSHLIDIKLGRAGKRGFPHIDYAATPTTKHPMFKLVCYDRKLTRDPDTPPFTGAEHQKFHDEYSYINDDVVIIFLNLSGTVMGDFEPN